LDAGDETRRSCRPRERSSSASPYNLRETSTGGSSGAAAFWKSPGSSKDIWRVAAGATRSANHSRVSRQIRNYKFWPLVGATITSNCRRLSRLHPSPACVLRGLDVLHCRMKRAVRNVFGQSMVFLRVSKLVLPLRVRSSNARRRFRGEHRPHAV